jgi:hypothetical protein
MDKEKFETFLLAEYDHIANAHFETGKQVSKFFNYYLLTLAASVVVVSLIQNQKFNSIINPGQDKDLQTLHGLIIIILSIIAVIGFFLCWIVVELQHDSILYARTVNGIRDYFYSEAKLSDAAEKSTRVLPRKVGKPDFLSKRHLGVIVATFTLVNTFFAGITFYLLWRGNLTPCLFIALIGFASAHFIAYYLLSKRRESIYGGPKANP